MPIAKVDAAWFASKAGEYRAGYLAGDGRFHAHFSVSGGYSFSVGSFNLSLGVGVKFNPDGIKFFHYEGGTLRKGIDWSGTINSSPLPGAGCSPEVGGFIGVGPAGVGGSYGQGGSLDIGFGSPGIQVVHGCVL